MKNSVTVETLLKTTQMIGELKEKRAQQEKLLAEMEYVIYMKYLWMLRNPDDDFDEKTSYYLKYWDRGSRIKGWLCVVRWSDKAEIRFPVFVKSMTFAGVIDMWDNGEIPERLIEIFFERNGSNHSKGYPLLGSAGQYRTQRDKRNEENEAFEERYGHPRSPRPLMDVIRVKPSGDEVRLDDFSRDDGPQEVVPSEGEEGEKSQEGETVA